MGKPVRNRRGATKLGEKLGERLRSIRQEKSWSLETLAERAGMHVTYLSSIERGYRNPTLNVIGSLAQALGLSLSELFDGVDKGGGR
jgi:transcriptional regulator with XRE-family HTH domain